MTRKIIKGTAYEVNPESERHRECPECLKIFETPNMNRKFCCQKCHDDYHNRIKRKKAQDEKEEIMKDDRAIVSRQDQDYINENIKLFDSLNLPEDGERNFYLSDLLKLGIRFDKCTLIHVLPGAKGCNCLEYGSYSVYLIESNIVLVKKRREVLLSC